MTDAPTLYDRDFVAWTEQQAGALRAYSHAGTNQALDWENLAEEIESLGRSDRRELRSQIYRIIRHLAKLQCSLAADPRHGWYDSVVDGRTQIEFLLADSPSLRREVTQIIVEQTPKAIKRAIFDLGEYGEIAPAIRRALLDATYTEEQVLGDWLPPEPRGSTDATQR